MQAHSMTERKKTAGQLIADFEKGGEKSVRQCIERGFYDAQTEMVAKRWLEGKVSQRNDSSQSEHLVIARSAKDAAWEAAKAARDAAREAKTANIIATLALMAAAIAIVISILGVFLR